MPMPMRFLLAALPALVVGCAGSSPPSGELTGLDAEVRRHPYRAALYLSPELDVAEASVATPDGEATEVWMGDYLRAQLVRATERTFEGVTLIDDEIYTGPTDEPHPAPELWPADAPGAVAPPDLVVACFPVELTGQVVEGGTCAECRDGLSFRIELYFEIRSLGGEVITSGKIGGQGYGQERPESDLPLAARFRQAVAGAVDEMSEQYALAIGGSEIVPSPGEMDMERYAERSTGSEAG
jgi:hypothetical protein